MMIEIPLDILHDLFGTTDIEPFMAVRVPGDAVLEPQILPMQNRMVIYDVSPPIPVKVTLSGDVSTTTFADWLSNQFLKSKYRRLVIDGRWVDAHPNEILAAITKGRNEPGSL